MTRHVTTIALLSTLLLIAAGCTIAEPAEIRVLCDESQSCSHSGAIAAFEAGINSPGTRLSLSHVTPDGRSLAKELCVPARYQGSALTGASRLLTAALEFLETPGSSVSEEFACESAAIGTTRRRFLVGPIAEDLGVNEVTVEPPGDARAVTYVAICDRSGSNEEDACTFDEISNYFRSSLLPQVASEQARAVVVDVRRSYGEAEVLLDRRLRSEGLSERVEEGRRLSTEVAAMNASDADSGSAIIGAISRSARRLAETPHDAARFAIFSDGREVSEGIDLTRARRFEGQIEALSEKLGETLTSGSLTGAEITWFGLRPNGLSPSEHRTLQEAWREGLVTAGAASVRFVDELRDGDVSADASGIAATSASP